MNHYVYGVTLSWVTKVYCYILWVRKKQDNWCSS